MSAVAILTVLLASALAFAQKFEVTDVSETSSPISFDGKATVSKAGTICTVTMHNNSPHSLIAVKISGEVTSPWGWMQSTGLNYDSFFKETGIPTGQGFDFVSPHLFASLGRGYTNGVLDKPEMQKKHLVCHAAFKVHFVQFEDGSTVGDYQVMKDFMAKRAKNIGIIRHLVEAYDTGGEAAFAAALSEPESTSMADLLKAMSTYLKIPLIDLVKKRLAVAQKRQASGIF